MFGNALHTYLGPDVKPGSIKQVNTITYPEFKVVFITTPSRDAFYANDDEDLKRYADLPLDKEKWYSGNTIGFSIRKHDCYGAVIATSLNDGYGLEVLQNMIYSKMMHAWISKSGCDDFVAFCKRSFTPKYIKPRLIALARTDRIIDLLTQAGIPDIVHGYVVTAIGVCVKEYYLEVVITNDLLYILEIHGAGNIDNPFATVYTITHSELHGLVLPYIYHNLRSIY